MPMNEVPTSPVPLTTTPDAPSLLWLCQFPGTPDQVREARHWIESILPDCDSRETIVLMASEFCSNAIEHTRSGSPGGHFIVHLAWSPSTVRLAVEDQGSSRPPEAVAATLDAEHGRGLLMVNAMATDWGFADTPKGRLVWADTAWCGQNGRDWAEKGTARRPDANLRLRCPTSREPSLL